MQSSPKTRRVGAVSGRRSIHRNSTSPVHFTTSNFNASGYADSASDDEEKTMSKASINDSSNKDCSSAALSTDAEREIYEKIKKRKSPSVKKDSCFNDRSRSLLLKDANADETRNPHKKTPQHIVPPATKLHCYISNTNEQSTSTYCYALMIVVMVAVITISMKAYGSFTTVPAGEKHCSYAKLSNRYPEQQESLWLSLTVGIENILNERSDKPCVFLFLHQGGQRMHNLVQEIATQSSYCFGGPTQLVKMQEDHFTSQQTKRDYGLAIEEYKLKVKQGHVVLIANLNKIPAETAPALHTICDIHNPIAKDVVIILTAETLQTSGNPTAIATDVLYKLWEHALPRNELDPLITRVTDQVITLRS